MLEAVFPTCVCMHAVEGAVPRGLGVAAEASEVVEVLGACRSLQFFSWWQKKTQRHHFAVLNLARFLSMGVLP